MEADLIELRRQVRPLLDISAPRDGLAAYYALYHDAARTRLYVEQERDRAIGFLAVCQTGRDLFRQLAVLRAYNPATAYALLRRGLQPRRPYYLLTTMDMQPVVEAAMEVERMQVNRVYRLDLRRYAPSLNVLVVPAPAADGTPRFVIRSQDQIAAEAGINWQSPHFAEVYVWTAPQARGRGWGRAVVDACVAWILRSGAQPLYVVSEGNEASARLAESAGFVDTGAREVAVEGTRAER